MRRTLVLLSALSAVFSAGLAGSVGATVVSVPNPPANIAPNPNLYVAGDCTRTAGNYVCQNPCVSNDLTWPAYSNDPGCTQYVLSAINNAREELGEVAITLPSNWYSLSDGEQLFVIINLERVGDGYVPFAGINATLNTAAETGAAAVQDPGPPSGFASEAGSAGGYYGSVWATGLSSLEADYLWMYDDGWSGTTTTNRDCTSASATACWGHRDILLGAGIDEQGGVGTNCSQCQVGVGYAVTGSTGAWAAIIEVPARSYAMEFTWAEETPYLEGASATTPPSTTTTTTTTPVTLRLVITSTVANTNMARATWELSGASVDKATMVVYVGTGCVKRAHSVLSVLLNGDVSSGVIVSSGLGFYSIDQVYSERVTVSVDGNTISSSCAYVGRG
jgi:hypothetical protein